MANATAERWRATTGRSATAIRASAWTSSKPTPATADRPVTRRAAPSQGAARPSAGCTHALPHSRASVPQRLLDLVERGEQAGVGAVPGVLHLAVRADDERGAVRGVAQPGPHRRLAQHAERRAG